MLNLRRIFFLGRGDSPLEEIMLRLRIASAILAAYWVALFISTHVPVHGTRGVRLPVDKFAHLMGYGLLALLLAWAIVGVSRMRAWTAVLLWLVIASYGVVDEITQGFVGRTPDFRDWVADGVGAMMGLSIYALAAAVFTRRRPEEQRN